MTRLLSIAALCGIVSLATYQSAQAGHGCHCPCGTAGTTYVAPTAPSTQVPPAPDAAAPAPPPPEGAAPAPNTTPPAPPPNAAAPAPSAAAPGPEGNSTAEAYRSFSAEPPAAAPAPTYTAPAYRYGGTYYGSPRYGSRVDRWMLPKTDPRRNNAH